MSNDFQPTYYGNQNNEAKPELTPEEMKEQLRKEREQVDALRDRAAKEVVSSPEALESFLDTQTRLDRYSAANVLLIHKLCPRATELKTAKEWNDAGIYIRKGERHIPIVVPVQDKEDASRTYYNVKRVFDISQTTSNKRKPAPSINRNPSEQLVAMYETAPIDVEAVDNLGYTDAVAIYNNGEGKLYVKKDVGDAAHLFQAVALELAFAELSVRSNVFDREAMTFDAVCTANIICKKYGIPAERYAITELPRELQNKDAKAIRNELSMIRNIAADMISRVSNELYRQHTAQNKEKADPVRDNAR